MKKHWLKKPLGEVAEFINGRAFKPSDWSSDGLPIIRIQNLTDPSANANRFSGEADKRGSSRVLVESGKGWGSSTEIIFFDTCQVADL